MKRVAYSQFMLPSPVAGKRPHASRWKMTNEQAAELGAVSIVPGTTEWREQPETEDEIRRAQFNYQSAGMDGAQPPRR
jgi:hypothetical protein